ncbi:MAG: hypothetical protein GY805_00025 [Chloroflexi bacterium]|nr:hypothetical protein [Chloroflexota bacterium]
MYTIGVTCAAVSPFSIDDWQRPFCTPTPWKAKKVALPRDRPQRERKTCPQQRVHPLAKVAKDVTAAAVLVRALGAVLIGLLLLGPPLWQKLFAG